MGSLQRPHWWCGNVYTDDDAPSVNNSSIMPHKSQSLNLVWVKESLANESTFMDEAIEREVQDIEVD